MNKNGIEVFMYDKASDDNKVMFFSVGQKFTFSAPKDYRGLGVDCSWTPIGSDGEARFVSEDQLEDGREYVVKSEYGDDEENPYPERLDSDEDESEKDD